MSAPLPLRFYNPIKELCEKVNLDYETVIGTGLSATMREAYILADIPKQLNEIDENDQNEARAKIEELNQKYGKKELATEDKGIERYNAGLIVEHLGTITTQEIDTKYGITTPSITHNKPIPYTRSLKWFPGKGLVSGTENEQ